ncbi:hypothetical protein B566_EDAN015752 [Ephemera danica]|nr:hypothetical protein B566_EDAN015752 [Ephemera danica]
MARYYCFPSFCVAVCCVLACSVSCYNVTDVNLPEEHLSYYFNAFPSVAEKCRNDSSCPYKAYLNKTACWGFEPGCRPENAFQQPKCTSHHKGWVKSKEEQLSTFYSQADFGYIRDQMNEMKIMCEPLFRDDSSLECSEHLRFCRGRNIMINLTDLASKTQPMRYKMDILSQGQIGGYCSFHEQRLLDQCDHVSPLQSWAPELRYFTKLSRRPIENNDCDIVIDKPTFIMKIDAAVNMYHHFCDFFNLYASLHLNATHPDAFTTDVNILIWETYTYTSSFSAAFKAFTQHPILDLKAFRGDVVCFKNVVFPLLPRMIFGLYYNTPIIHGCEGSGLFKAFSEFMLHRLGIASRPPLSTTSAVEDEEEEEKIQHDKHKIRVTLLSRETTYRRILNEDELLDALRNNPDYSVQRVVYSRHLPFRKQLELTHHNENCYKDLARLRGIKYLTWEKQDELQQEDEGHHPDGGAHAKFTNYAFDVEEFVRLVGVAAQHVRQHEAYRALRNATSTTKDTPQFTSHDEL